MKNNCNTFNKSHLKCDKHGFGTELLDKYQKVFSQVHYIVLDVKDRVVVLLIDLTRFISFSLEIIYI